MRLYVAGPMSGYKDFNFPAFLRATRALIALGFDVTNPAEKESTADGKPDLSSIPVAWGGTNQDITPGSIRAKDIRDLLLCTGVVLLEGWVESWGALLEAAIAQTCGMKLFTLVFHHDDSWSLSELAPSWVLRTIIDWQEKGHQDKGNTDCEELREAHG